MAISWALAVTVAGFFLALTLGYYVNHTSRKETDAAIRRNQHVLCEVSNLLGRIVDATNHASDSAGCGGGDQRLLSDDRGATLDNPAKS
jgi:hypothetical protein